MITGKSTYIGAGSPYKMIISWGNLGQNLFIISIFLYPLTLVNHLLYLIPQMILMGLSITINKKLTAHDFFIFMFGISASIIPFLIEFSSQEPSFDLSIKLIINTLFILLLTGSSGLKFNELALLKIKIIVILWTLMSATLYVKNGVIDISSFYYMISSSGSLDSSSLYGIAEPLGAIFLTKNISAMFIVSTFSLYIYISDGIGKRVGIYEFLLFFFSSAAFLSRQGILACIVLYAIYLFITSGKIKRIVYVLSFASLSVIFFLAFFDLSSENDGASQRIELWIYFFDNAWKFYLLGMGISDLNQTLMTSIGIDNFHMFFMNQIGAYGIIHFMFFSIFISLVCLRGRPTRGRIFLLSAYMLNVCFQTYGYEYGNLMLLAAMYFTPSISGSRNIVNV